jgi:hypothetical protein
MEPGAASSVLHRQSDLRRNACRRRGRHDGARLRRPATPQTRTALEQLVGRYAKHYGIPQARVRNWISFMVLSGALERVHDETGTVAFIVKGGVALELRLRLRARATRDFDATFRENFGEMLSVLDDALEQPYGDFRFMRRGEIRDLGGKAKRIEIRVQYRTKPWSTVQMEVSVAEDQDVEVDRVPATDLSELGLDGPEFVQCLSVRIQIAQKIHAVTSPRAGTGRMNATAISWISGCCASSAPIQVQCAGRARMSLRAERRMRGHPN